MIQAEHAGLEALRHGFFMLDSGWRVTYWNGAAEEMLDLSRSAVLGERLEYALPQLCVAPLTHAMLRACERGSREVCTGELMLGGKLRRLRMSATPAGDGVAVQLEDASPEVEERSAALLESIRHGFLAVDSQWRIIYLNSMAESLLRLPRERAVGSPLWTMLPREPGSIRETLRATMEDGIQRHLASVMPEGRVFRGRVFDLWTYPLPDGGISILFEEVSERVQYEHELARLAAEAEEANRAKSRFFAAISHELRTPLNAIIGYVYLLTSQAYGEMPSGACRAAERSAVCAEHLARLIDDVLLMTTAEIDRLPVCPAEVDLARLLPTVVEPHRQQAEAKNLAFLLEVAPDLPIVETDAQRVRQLVGALLSNAVKFTKRGKIRVSARYTEVEDAEQLYTLFPEPRVQITVSDTGPGIAVEDQQRIFEAFEQLGDPSRSASMERGTGLGLTIASKLTARLGGTIKLTSRPGIGSDFIISLPLRPTAVDAE